MNQIQSLETLNKPKIELKEVIINQEKFFKISHHAHMRPFFMSIVSDSDHWMFISSNGGLSAGRKNAEYSLFPYYTDDKITEFADITGSKTIFQINNNGQVHIWEPFSDKNLRNFSIERHLYKHVYGNKIIFEEINLSLGLCFQYQWSSSDKFGFLKTSTLTNLSQHSYQISVLDGIQNLLPASVNSDLQRASSNLVDAYKRNELHAASGLGIYALSAIIVDKAEPSEALKANVVWSAGLDNPTYLVSSMQLYKFREGKAVVQETDIKGEKGAYFVNKTLNLQAQQSKTWYTVANVNLNHSQVFSLIHQIQKTNLIDEVIEDVAYGVKNIKKLNASADAIQQSSDSLNDFRHFSNVMFNIMRGGIFDDNYQIDKQDFIKYILQANKNLYQNFQSQLQSLSETVSYFELKNLAEQSQNNDFSRLTTEYLPLKFSRRHGDPSRPWNKFSINLKDDKGTKILDYQGNWRDIFQNWEALAYSYPAFIDGMIYKFLNASTFDGYNPYRVTKDGFDWEIIEPDDPWSYIGYWGDHQIIYLCKFLEFSQQFYPKKLANLVNQDHFVYAAVPYKIKPYEDIVKNPKDTIEFDHHWDAKIRTSREQLGSDGALLLNTDAEIHKVNFMEKILATVLSKMSNFIPEAGIWMNTQRPEWNDANNALVGNGVSMVTLYYLRRFLVVLQEILNDLPEQSVKISNELVEFYHAVRETLWNHRHWLSDKISDEKRKELVDILGKAGSDYRHHIYQNGFWGKKLTVSLDGLKRFTQVSLDFIDHSIKLNCRQDHLYHAYNLISVEDKKFSVLRLSEMLEGQVSAMSSKKLSSQEVLNLLNGMKNSALFRPDQYSYLLYPNKELPKFLEKNIIDPTDVNQSKLLKTLITDKNIDIIEQNVFGQYHFNGNFRNINDLLESLPKLPEQYQALAKQEEKLIAQIFEKVFNHKAFTGRSGTFFGYEGLGSIYWHMVSKLLLAVQECCLDAINTQQDPKVIGKLLDHYFEIKAGIGVHKNPELYGAFPTDPYSHTPYHRGAQQPGMTGQVKEDILVKWGELGVYAIQGLIHFNPQLLRVADFTTKPSQVDYVNLQGEITSLPLPEKCLFFTYCQTPVVYQLSNKDTLEVTIDNKTETLEGFTLNQYYSQALINRTSNIQLIKVNINISKLIN